ncbi:MAG: nucleotidyltransferase [Desulfuromonadales bacterium]|nr:MAG: nucleotidyltransferase [Desulfuromonadales bacterium]
MPLFLGAKGEDVLTRRGTVEFVQRFRQGLYGAMAELPVAGELALLQGVKEALAAELAFEAGHGEQVRSALDEAAESASVTELSALRERLRGLADEHFRRRGSVPVYHLLCTAAADRLAAAALRLAALWQEQAGFGAPPAPWCWMAIGSVGRGETSLAGDGDFLLIHGGEGAAAFVGFAARGAGMMEQMGLAGSVGITPSTPAWRGSIADWRKRVTARVAHGDGDLDGLIRLADLRLVAGDPNLAGEMVNLIRSMLSFHREPLHEMARRVAMMPSGFDFFGRLRLERGGGHRGLFNLGFYGIEPLVDNVRVMAVRFDIPETGTLARLQGLLHERRIDVALAERLLQAWHLFGRHAVGGGISGAAGVFVDPETLSERALDELKAGVEAVGALQKIVYSSVTGLV